MFGKSKSMPLKNKVPTIKPKKTSESPSPFILMDREPFEEKLNYLDITQDSESNIQINNNNIRSNSFQAVKFSILKFLIKKNDNKVR